MRPRRKFGRQIPVLVASATLILLFLAIVDFPAPPLATALEAMLPAAAHAIGHG